MKNLFIIDGLGGTGKSDLINYVRKTYEPIGSTSILSKYTTRKERKIEKKTNLSLNLEVITKNEFISKKLAKNDFYYYQFNGVEYGFYKHELENLLEEFQNTFLIVRSKNLVDKLSKDFPDINVILVYVYSDKESIIKRLSQEGYSEQDIQYRLSRISASWEDYLLNNNFYREIIINNSSISDFHRMIDFLIEKYNSFPKNKLIINRNHQYDLLKPLEGFKKNMLNNLKKYPFEKNVFVMMKFRNSNKLIHKFIKEVLHSHGYNCVRADDEQWDLTGDVYNPLAVLYCCKYGIALFDEPEEGSNYSPNVAYELGIMHYQHKNCLILKHNKLPSIPFDLIKNLHVPYSDNLEVQDIITTWVKKLERIK